MLIRYRQVIKCFFACLIIYLIILYHVKTKNSILIKRRFEALKLPLYECRGRETIKEFQEPFIQWLSKNKPSNVHLRILIVADLKSKHVKEITKIIGYFKVPIRVESPETIQLFEIVLEGRFSLIIFDDYRHFLGFSNEEKELLLDYCRKFNVGIISFYSSSAETSSEAKMEQFMVYEAEYAVNLRFPENSPIRFVAKSSAVLPSPEQYRPDWALFDNFTNGTAILLAENYYGDVKAAAFLMRQNNSDHIIIGNSLQYWIVKLTLLDSIIYMAPNLAQYNLEK